MDKLFSEVNVLKWILNRRLRWIYVRPFIVGVWGRGRLIWRINLFKQWRALAKKSVRNDNGSAGIWRWNFRDSLWAFSSFRRHTPRINNSVDMARRLTKTYVIVMRKLVYIANTSTHAKTVFWFSTVFSCSHTPTKLDICFYCYNVLAFIAMAIRCWLLAWERKHVSDDEIRCYRNVLRGSNIISNMMKYNEKFSGCGVVFLTSIITLMSFVIRRSSVSFGEEKNWEALQPNSFKFFDVVNAATTTVFFGILMSRPELKNMGRKKTEPKKSHLFQTSRVVAICKLWWMKINPKSFQK